VPTPLDDSILERRPIGPGSRRFGPFASVGAFAIDASILSTLVHGLGWPHYTARARSFDATVTATWYCNRRFVFGTTADRSREYGADFTTQLVGAVLNLGTYVLAIVSFPALAAVPVVPLRIGAAVALLFNYAGASRWAFARRSRPTGGPA